MAEAAVMRNAAFPVLKSNPHSDGSAGVYGSLKKEPVTDVLARWHEHEIERSFGREGNEAPPCFVDKKLFK